MSSSHTHLLVLHCVHLLESSKSSFLSKGIKIDSGRLQAVFFCICLLVK